MARARSPITALSTSPVRTNVLVYATRNSSAAFEDPNPKGPRPCMVYQVAIAHTNALIVVTSRWRKRIAAQMINGSVMNASGSDEASPGTLPKMMNVVSASADAREPASIAFGNDHRRQAPTYQLAMSGVTMIMPEASPCHHVQALTTNSLQGSAFKSETELTPTAAAMAALRAANPANLTTASPVSKLPRMPV